MSGMQEPTKHHYIPEFYLRQWAGRTDGRLQRYNKPIPTKMVVRRVFPSEIGWTRNLYASPGHRKGPQWLEKHIFQIIDDKAAPVLRKLNLDPVPELSGGERSAWTLFLRSLSHRTPENLRATISSAISMHDDALNELKDIYDDHKQPGDPSSFEEYRESLTEDNRRHVAQDILPGIMANPHIGQFLHDLHTRVICIPHGHHEFLLSDDPMARSNGLMNDNGHLAIPISPQRLFVSTYTEALLDRILKMPPGELVANMNRWTVEGARHFVAATDRSQERFIRNRFGLDPKPPLMA